MPRLLKRDMHGTYACYCNGGCRCEACRAAYRTRYWAARGFSEPPPKRVPKPPRVKLTEGEWRTRKEATKRRWLETSRKRKAQKSAAMTKEERHEAYLRVRDAKNARRRELNRLRREARKPQKEAKRLAAAVARRARRKEYRRSRIAADPAYAERRRQSARDTAARKKAADPDGFKRARHESYLRNKATYVAYARKHPGRSGSKRRTPEGKLIDNLRGRLKELLGPLGRKSARLIALIGCTRAELRGHIAAKFLPGMTWDNYGTAWHIDHIMPMASFNLAVPEQQRACCRYTNLQPLWDEINIEKSDSILFDTAYAVAMTPYPA